VLKNLTRANERCMAFGYEVVIENRVCVWFSEESVWSVIGGRRREAPVCDDKFNGVEHIDDDCFYYHSWRNNVVIAFGTLSSFLT